ncbi:MAG: hypothetical protein PHS31_09355 [Victivallaceae bacterium]|nr:hypothetical protein [Victivallaceae bacterium]MDD4180763.1 hypothetical protein [Victivallaceae bacterium]
MNMFHCVTVCAVFALFTISGCAFIGFDEISPNWHETRALSESYQVINAEAQSASDIHQISLVVIPIVRWGDGFEVGRSKILEQNPGAEDIINIRHNVTGINLLLYQHYHINSRGTAIKYTSDGVGNPSKIHKKNTTK